MKRNYICFSIAVFFLATCAAWSDQRAIIVSIEEYGKNGFTGKFDRTFSYDFDQTGRLDRLEVSIASGASSAENKVYKIERTAKQVLVVDSRGEPQITVDITGMEMYELKRSWSPSTVFISQERNKYFVGVQEKIQDRLLTFEWKSEGLEVRYQRNGKPINEFPLVDFVASSARKTPAVKLLGNNGLIERTPSKASRYRQLDSDGVPVRQFSVTEVGQSVGQISVIDLMIDYYLGTKAEYPLVTAFLVQTGRFADFQP